MKVTTYLTSRDQAEINGRVRRERLGEVRPGLARPLLRMPAQPGLDVGARRHDPHSSLAGVGQGRPHQRVADAAPLSGGWELGMLEVENVIAERRVDQLRVAVGEGEVEAGVVGVMPNGHAGPSRRIVSHE